MIKDPNLTKQFVHIWGLTVKLIEEFYGHKKMFNFFLADI